MLPSTPGCRSCLAHQFTPRSVHVASTRARRELLAPPVHPLVGGQHLRRRQLPPGQPRIPRRLRPPFQPRLLSRLLPAFLRLLRRDLHHRPGDRGGQPGRGQPPRPLPPAPPYPPAPGVSPPPPARPASPPG